MKIVGGTDYEPAPSADKSPGDIFWGSLPVEERQRRVQRAGEILRKTQRDNAVLRGEGRDAVTCGKFVANETPVFIGNEI